MRRVVVTGVGVVAPNGIGKEAFWSACVEGRSGIGPDPLFRRLVASRARRRRGPGVRRRHLYPRIPTARV